MTYAYQGAIASTDFNSLVGATNSTTANQLNGIWGVGFASMGYGQSPPINNKSTYEPLSSGDWANLITTTNTIALHQDNAATITSVTVPTTYSAVQYSANNSNNLITIYTNRLSAYLQGTTSANVVTRATTWSTALTFTHTVTFANAYAARYFFNAGGQLKITCSHANSATSLNTVFNTLASQVGTITISAPGDSSTLKIGGTGGTTYNGITKIGGSGNTPTIDATKGYYGLSTANATVFTQLATGDATYQTSYISVIAKTNASNATGTGDKGNILTIYTVWDVIPNTASVGSGSTTTLTVVPPSTSQLANTWGAITNTGTVSGS